MGMAPRFDGGFGGYRLLLNCPATRFSPKNYGAQLECTICDVLV